MITYIICGIILLLLTCGVIYVLVDSIQPLPPKPRRRKKHKQNNTPICTDKTANYIEAAWEEIQK